MFQTADERKLTCNLVVSPNSWPQTVHVNICFSSSECILLCTSNAFVLGNISPHVVHGCWLSWNNKCWQGMSLCSSLQKKISIYKMSTSKIIIWYVATTFTFRHKYRIACPDQHSCVRNHNQRFAYLWETKYLRYFRREFEVSFCVPGWRVALEIRSRGIWYNVRIFLLYGLAACASPVDF